MSLCSQCNGALLEKFVKCYNCNSLYHFSPCCSLSEKTYYGMSNERRADWRCQKCKPRKASTSSNNAYHVIIDDSTHPTPQQKQLRDDDNSDIETSKRFKNSLCLNEIQNNVCQLQSDMKSYDTKFNEIKESIQQMSILINQNTQVISNFQTTITNTISTLTMQVNELCDKNKQKEKQMQEMDNRINDLEQQLLNRTIEIKNIPDDKLTANEVIKSIASSVEVVVNDVDICNSYHLKKSKKIIAEFTTVNKKKELMGNIKRHRIESKLITADENDKNFIYINEHLTAYKRHLLWLTKTKAKDSNWRFVWVKNGNIFAKKMKYLTLL